MSTTHFISNQLSPPCPAENSTQKQCRECCQHHFKQRHITFPRSNMLPPHHEQYIEYLCQHVERLTPDQKQWEIKDFIKKKGDVFQCGKPCFNPRGWSKLFKDEHCDCDLREITDCKCELNVSQQFDGVKFNSKKNTMYKGPYKKWDIVQST